MRPILPVLLVALSTLLLTSAWAQAPAQATLTAQAGSLIAWRSLTSEQQAALQPLSKLWPTMGADQQRKWVALVGNFNRMSPDERTTLQSRMTEWANLTPAQRTQARLNFGEVRRVPADERRAKCRNTRPCRSRSASAWPTTGPSHRAVRHPRCGRRRPIACCAPRAPPCRWPRPPGRHLPPRRSRRRP